MFKDDLGDRMKQYESAQTSLRFDARQPLYARIDGRGFSKFTKGMVRPFDAEFHACMVETASYLVQKTNAVIGYTQSDEISLLWYLDGENPAQELMFGGKVQKLCSILAGMATARFNQAVLASSEQFAKNADKLPHFDARVFELPSKEEAANAILWRVLDAERNSVSMAAHHHLSHKRLNGVSRQGMVELLSEKGVTFEDYPEAFKRGTFIRSEVFEAELPAEKLVLIPEARRPTGPVVRSRLRTFHFPKILKIKNRVEMIFEDADPVFHADAG
jgi:tRNA(His) 5'-end guanylyltransferase